MSLKNKPERLEVKEMPLRSNGEAKTEWIIPGQDFKAQEHDWVQSGSELRCDSCQFSHGTFISPMKTLVGKRGEWQIIDTPVSR